MEGAFAFVAAGGKEKVTAPGRGENEKRGQSADIQV